MNGKVETTDVKLDGARLLLAAVVTVAGLGGFYYFADQPLFVRVIGLLAVVGVAVAVALTSTRGREAWQFLVDARMEVRKVVWPGRTETTQTTLLVVVMVFIVALLLWGYDSLLGWLLTWFTGLGA